MGMSRISTFLHALASSSGVSEGGVSVSIESDSLFERYSAYAFGCLSSEAIGKATVKKRGGRRRKKRGREES